MVTQRQNDSTTGYKPAVLETKPKFLFLRNENLDPGPCGLQPTMATSSQSEDTLSQTLETELTNQGKRTHPSLESP